MGRDAGCGLIRLGVLSAAGVWEVCTWAASRVAPVVFFGDEALEPDEDVACFALEGEFKVLRPSRA